MFRAIIIVMVLVGLFPLYWKLGAFGSAIYAEAKFEEIRFGPHETLADVDTALSWFRRTEIPVDDVPPRIVRSLEGEADLEVVNAMFIAYYVREFGFVVVYDEDGRKMTQIKTDV